MPKRIGWRVIPEPGARIDGVGVTVVPIRYVPIYAAEAQSKWTGWRSRARGERGTNPLILPPLRAKLAKGVPTIAVYSDGLHFRACESGAIVDPDRVHERRAPSGRLWTKGQVRVTTATVICATKVMALRPVRGENGVTTLARELVPRHSPVRNAQGGLVDRLSSKWQTTSSALEDTHEFERTEAKGLYVPTVRQSAQAPVGEKLGADNIIRPTDAQGNVRF